MKSDAFSDLAMTRVSAGIAKDSALATAGIDPDAVKGAAEAADAAADAKDAADAAKSVADVANADDLSIDAKLFSAKLDNAFNSLQPRKTLYDPQAGLEMAINNSIIKNMPPSYGLVSPTGFGSNNFMSGYFNFMNKNR